MANKRQNAQAMNAKNMQAFQGSLEDAEKALAGDPLQEAVRRKKGAQQFNM
ncbi:small acid-soluble spore protein SspJ [Oceanobacillus sp. Castelsardo]|uniref:small acid-soluble spore protein SspJ n=1 Tax=Oceanobacillus sp. Castelsardo TaxID=1851204 RepID=UPI000838B103|nr:small acid-soluble spore protein SspJ [Oceanobacillus sp. Castelsardo]